MKNNNFEKKVPKNVRKLRFSALKISRNSNNLEIRKSTNARNSLSPLFEKDSLRASIQTKKESKKKINLQHPSFRLSMNNSPTMSYTITPEHKTHRLIDLSRKNRFKFIYQIGFGGFGKVWKVQDKINGKIWASKQISKKKVFLKKSIDSVINERNILVKLNHPFIINMRQAFQDEQYLYLIMEYLRGADLRYHLCYKPNWTEQEAKFLIACIILSLQYTHSMNIIHKDLKPENIVFQQNGYARLTDYGIAKIKLKSNKIFQSQTSGTPGYIAPQILSRDQFSFNSDFFGVGIILYEIMFNQRPYQTKNKEEVKKNTMKYQICLKQQNTPKYWNQNSISFLNKMLKINPKERFQNTTEIKNHPWFQTIKWKAIEQKKQIAPFIPSNVCQSKDYLDQIAMYNQIKKQNCQNINLQQILEANIFKDYDYRFDKTNRNQKLSIKCRRRKDSQIKIKQKHKINKMRS